MKVTPDVEAPEPPPSSPSKSQPSSFREQAMEAARKRSDDIKALKVNLNISFHLHLLNETYFLIRKNITPPSNKNFEGNVFKMQKVIVSIICSHDLFVTRRVKSQSLKLGSSIRNQSAMECVHPLRTYQISVVFLLSSFYIMNRMSNI